MSDLSDFHRTQSEQIHRELYGVHRDIYFNALEKIKSALMICHELEGNPDLREQVRDYITSFEGLRWALEEAGKQAADLRSELIRSNGCSGECTKENPAQR